MEAAAMININDYSTLCPNIPSAWARFFNIMDKFEAGACSRRENGVNYTV
jgi:hypothetical protein